MKYYYEHPEISSRVFGKVIRLNHPVYLSGTLYSERGLGIIVVQQHFDAERRECRWTAVDADIANDIYLAPRFLEFFLENARKEDYPIFHMRHIMWMLRMKPLKREEWEGYF